MTEQRSRKMPRRLLAWLLAVCMVCTLLPVTALAGDVDKPYEVDTTERCIYANGAPLLIAESGSGTTVYWDKDGNGVRDDGEPTVYEIGSDTNWHIYGGGNGNHVNGDTKLTMTGGKVEQLRGGGFECNVNGTAFIKVTGGEVKNIVAGSALAGTVSQNSVTIGGTAKVGTGNLDGVLIGSGDDDIQSFAIDPNLEKDALIFIELSASYGTGTVATGATASDLAHLKLVGTGAAGKMLKLAGSEIQVIEAPELEGEGTAENPYRVTSYADLAALAARVNAGRESYAGKHIKVTDNFPTESGAVTTAIGTLYKSFQGSFDGNGQTIQLDIDAPKSDYQGLFGAVESESVGAAIKNVIVSGSVTGAGSVGGVAGYVKKGNLTNCVNTCAVTGTANVGGIVGHNTQMVENSYNTGTVTGTGMYVGGVAGYSATNGIKYCYNAGMVTSASYNAGGVAGTNMTGCKVQNCLSLGLAVSGTRGGGRITGSSDGSPLVDNQARRDTVLIVNGTETYPVTGGAADNENGADLAVDGTVTVKNAFTGWDEDIWNIPDGPLVIGCELPTLKSAPQIPAPILPIGSVIVTTQDNVSTQYGQLADALAAAEDNPGSTLQLLDDVQGNYECETAAAFTIDLNGKTWTAKKTVPTLSVRHEDADITITDTAGDGKIGGSMNAIAVTSGKVTVSGSKTLTLASDYSEGLYVDASGSVRLTNPNAVYTGGTGLWFEGTGTYEITGGTFTGSMFGIRLNGGSQQGVLSVTKALGESVYGLGIENTSVTIAGGEYTGFSGLRLGTAGFAKLQGGTFTGTGGYAVDAARTEPALSVGGLLAEGYGYFQNGEQIADETVLGGQELAEKGTVTVGRIQTGTGAYTISGKVMEKNGEAVLGATVTLTQGGNTISSATANENGIYRFTGIEPGSYNITAAHGGKNATVLVTVADADVTADITLPAENVSAVVQVKGENTPAVVVDGLTEEAETLVEDGKTVTLAMTVEAKTGAEAETTEAALIQAEAGGKTLEFLEIKLEKQVDGGEPESVTSTNGLLTIVIPYDLTGKQDVAVYRSHGGSVDTLTTTANEDDEKIELGANSITLRVKKFSTYAIGYTTGGTDGGHSSSSGSAARYTITATAGQGGTIAPSGKVSVTRGENKVFAITPNDGYEIADVLVDGKSVGAVKSYTFEKVSAAHTIEAKFQQTGGKAAWNPFSDVREGDWFYDSVRYAYEHDLMNGVSATSFAPHDSTTRGMIVTILWRMAGQPESGETSAFADVRPGSYCDDAVRWAAAQGVVKGYDAQSFGPDDAITREQLAAILYRYAGSPAAAGTLDAFADAAASSPYALDALRWAAEQGILTGKEDNRLDPKGPATRAEAAAVFMRYIEQRESQ